MTIKRHIDAIKTEIFEANALDSTNRQREQMPIEEKHDEDTLTVEEVAAWLRVTESWVREHASGRRRPQIPSEKFGRYVRFRWGSLKIWRKSMERR